MVTSSVKKVVKFQNFFCRVDWQMSYKSMIQHKLQVLGSSCWPSWKQKHEKFERRYLSLLKLYSNCCYSYCCHALLLMGRAGVISLGTNFSPICILVPQCTSFTLFWKNNQKNAAHIHRVLGSCGFQRCGFYLCAFLKK